MNIRFGTFNLFQFVAPSMFWYDKEGFYTKERWKQKLTWIKKQIIKMDCDVIGFQEVFSVQELEDLVTELGFEYFEVIDKPKIAKENENIYISSVVAIASKYPIENIQTVERNEEIINQLGVDENFKFSRKPIKARIHIDGFADIKVYICHLKSKMILVDDLDVCKEDTKEFKMMKYAQTSSINRNLSLLKRVCESSTIYSDIAETIHANTNRAVVLMGDFNDTNDSDSIKSLTNHNLEIDEEHQELKDYILYDSYDFMDKRKKRKATNFYKNKGEVIDYVFVSNVFNQNNKNSLGIVKNMEVFDEHLQDEDLLLKSDHAQVICEIEIK